MSETFDWSALLKRAEAASFEPVPDGRYHVSVFESEATTSSTNKPMIKLKVQIEDGAYKNRKLFDQFVLSPDSEIALAIFFSKLKAFGIGPEFLAKCPPGQLGPVATALHSKHAIANVSHKEWQGQMRNEIKGYSPLGSGTPTQNGPSGVSGSSGGSSLPGLPGLPGLSSPTTPVAEPVTEDAAEAPASPSVPAMALPGLVLPPADGELPF